MAPSIRILDISDVLTAVYTKNNRKCAARRSQRLQRAVTPTLRAQSIKKLVPSPRLVGAVCPSLVISALLNAPWWGRIGACREEEG
jgi:hypothetical protein